MNLSWSKVGLAIYFMFKFGCVVAGGVIAFVLPAAVLAAIAGLRR